MGDSTSTDLASAAFSHHTRTPVAGLGIAESEEHRLEEGAALAAAFELLWRNTSRSCQRDGRQNGRPTRT